MDIFSIVETLFERLTELFKWCTIFNGGLLAFWAFLILVFPDRIYRLQSRWTTVSRETFDVVMYAGLGMLKIGYLTCNVVPYVSLLIITSE